MPSILNVTPFGVLGDAGVITEALYRGARAAGEDFVLDSTSYINEDSGVDQQSDNATFQITHNINEHELVYLAG